jgi:hypothetical protein
MAESKYPRLHPLPIRRKNEPRIIYTVLINGARSTAKVPINKWTQRSQIARRTFSKKARRRAF